MHIDDRPILKPIQWHCLLRALLCSSNLLLVLRSGTFCVYCFRIAASGSKFGNFIEPTEDSNPDKNDVDALKRYRNTSNVCCNGPVVEYAVLLNQS